MTKLSTEAIREAIGWELSRAVAARAHAELAAILQRDEDWKRCALNTADKLRAVRIETDKQLAVMREAIRWARDELFAHGYAQGESARYDKIIKRLESALTPDDGKRVVDVELLRDLVGLLHSLTNDPMLRISIQVFLDKLAALIGEGE